MRLGHEDGRWNNTPRPKSWEKSRAGTFFGSLKQTTPRLNFDPGSWSRSKVHVVVNTYWGSYPVMKSLVLLSVTSLESSLHRCQSQFVLLGLTEPATFFFFRLVTSNIFIYPIFILICVGFDYSWANMKYVSLPCFSILPCWSRAPRCLQTWSSNCIRTDNKNCATFPFNILIFSIFFRSPTACCCFKGSSSAW